MTTLPFETLSASWGVASGIAVSLLGLYALKGRRTRPKGALAFGLFALLWGIQIAAINASSLNAFAPFAEHLFLIALVALFPLPYFLTEFAASQTKERGRRLGWRFARAGTAALALTSAGLFLLRPSLLFEGTMFLHGLYYPVWGPGFYALVSIPFFVFLGLALVTLRASHLESPSVRTRRWSGLLLVGLGIYTGYTAGNHVLVYSETAWELGAGSDWHVMGYLIVFALLSTLVVILGADAVRRWNKAYAPSDRKLEGWIALGLLVPFAAGLGEEALFLAGVPDFQTVGAWRLLGVGVITYGLARRRLFDLPQRSRRWGAKAAGAAVALAVGGTMFGVGSILTENTAFSFFIGGVMALGTVYPAVDRSKRLLGVSGRNPVEASEELYEQKIETYRAAVEDAMARDAFESDQAFLEGLRESFGISREEARIIRYFARNATVSRGANGSTLAYDKLRLLDEGAGRTWLARDRSRDRLVLLKEPLDPWHREPALLEATREAAKTASNIRHKNVVEIEQILEEDGHPILVTPHITGETLTDELRRTGVLEPSRALKIIFDTAQGLHAIHAAGLVHGNLRPEHILLTPDGRAIISDLGLAPSKDNSGTRVFTNQAEVNGYQAPEAPLGSQDPAVDVYALAAILHACLYGSPPGEGTVQATVNVPPKLQSVLEKGLHKDPSARYQDAHAFHTALERLITDEPPTIETSPT